MPARSGAYDCFSAGQADSDLGFRMTMTPQRHLYTRCVALTCHSGPMADSNAVRSRRKRLHAQGDHSTCRHFPLAPRPVMVAAAVDGDEFDPVAELRLLAARVVDAYRQDPGNAALAREARVTLLALMDKEPNEDDAGWAAFVDSLSTPTNTDEDGSHG